MMTHIYSHSVTLVNKAFAIVIVIRQCVGDYSIVTNFTRIQIQINMLKWIKIAKRIDPKHTHTRTLPLYHTVFAHGENDKQQFYKIGPSETQVAFLWPNQNGVCVVVCVLGNSI